MIEELELGHHIVSKTNWHLLQQQKITLNSVIERYSLSDKYDPLIQDLVRLQNFLDNLQDKVVELNLVDKETVFGKED